MITLTYSVIANLFFGQVTDVSGFGGISGIPAPHAIGNVDAHPNRLYYVALVVALAVYALLRYIVRTPFGLTLQGVRDDPVRMASLGYNVALHRTLAFAFAAFIAAIGGVLFVWWNGHIDPASIDLGATIDVLVIAVIGGLYRLEGAWVGALFFVIINNYSQRIGFIGPRFHTLIGAIFLVIVLVSPGGLIGLWERVVDALLRAAPGPARSHPIERRAGRAQRLKGGAARRRHGSCRVDVTPQSSSQHQPVRKEEGIRMSALKRRWKLIPLAALAVLAAASPRRRRRPPLARQRRRSRSPSCPTARARSARSTTRTSRASSPRCRSTPARSR